MGEESQVIAIGSALKKGGSLQITIPKEVVKILELEPGDNVLFVYDPKTKQILLNKVAKFVTPSGLSFSISKEAVKKFLKEEER